MQTLIYISLAVNIVVLIPIVVLMSMRARLVDKAWGPFTEARGILLSILWVRADVAVDGCALARHFSEGEDSKCVTRFLMS